MSNAGTLSQKKNTNYLQLEWHKFPRWDNGLTWAVKQRWVLLMSKVCLLRFQRLLAPFTFSRCLISHLWESVLAAEVVIIQDLWWRKQWRRDSVTLLLSTRQTIFSNKFPFPSTSGKHVYTQLSVQWISGLVGSICEWASFEKHISLQGRAES